MRFAVRRPEMNAMFRTLYSDLRYGRQIDKPIRSTAPYSATRETMTSVGLAHARPIMYTCEKG